MTYFNGYQEGDVIRIIREATVVSNKNGVLTYRAPMGSNFVHDSDTVELVGRPPVKFETGAIYTYRNTYNTDSTGGRFSDSENKYLRVDDGWISLDLEEVAGGQLRKICDENYGHWLTLEGWRKIL
jgi:hypothetical protein